MQHEKSKGGISTWSYLLASCMTWHASLKRAAAGDCSSPIIELCLSDSASVLVNLVMRLLGCASALSHCNGVVCIFSITAFTFDNLEQANHLAFLRFEVWHIVRLCTSDPQLPRQENTTQLRRTFEIIRDRPTCAPLSRTACTSQFSRTVL